MEMIKILLDLMNAICKIAFITYAWLTMLRINIYIMEQQKVGNRE